MKDICLFHSVLEQILHSLDAMLRSAIIAIAVHSQTCSVCNHSARGDSRRQTPVQWSWRGLCKVLNSSVGLVSSLLCQKEQNDRYQSRIKGRWAGHSCDCFIQFMQFYENEGQQTLEKMLKMSPLDCIKSTLVLTLLVALSVTAFCSSSWTAQWEFFWMLSRFEVCRAIASTYNMCQPYTIYCYKQPLLLWHTLDVVSQHEML